ncbi:MAG TPA: Fur family transcriptional regulator [Acidimicrobiales bacterium]|nr:Fur family transcriptional regulator [Acidimicrobiales bacterium]
MGVTASVADLHEEVAQRLASRGRRYTTARRAIVEVLAAAGAPLSIAGLRRQDGSLALSSAYRNLSVLERSGVVHRVVGADDLARYELAEELTGHHHHLICTTCGDVRDFTVSPELEGDLDRALARIARAHGFVVDHHRLDLVGTCPGCG